MAANFCFLDWNTNLSWFVRYEIRRGLFRNDDPLHGLCPGRMRRRLDLALVVDHRLRAPGVHGLVWYRINRCRDS